MLDASQTSQPWSDRLAEKLLADLSADQLAKLLQAHTQFNPLDAGLSPTLRASLISLARSNTDWQRAIMQTWRSTHPEIVAAAESVAIESSPDHCAAMIDQFGCEQILLEVITDPNGDGWEVAHWMVGNFPAEGARQQLEEGLRRLSGIDEETAKIALPRSTEAKIVIFGGHPRDESKMTRRLFAGSQFQVRWKPCDKSSPDDKFIHEAMASADVVILVTSMVSHNVMLAARRYAQKHGILFRAVTKATDIQLGEVLQEIFPETAN